MEAEVVVVVVVEGALDLVIALNIFFCNHLGHTRDRCYSLYGFLEKSTNVIQSQTSDIESDNQNVLSDSEYKEYFQFKAT